MTALVARPTPSATSDGSEPQDTCQTDRSVRKTLSAIVDKVHHLRAQTNWDSSADTQLFSLESTSLNDSDAAVKALEKLNASLPESHQYPTFSASVCRSLQAEPRARTSSWRDWMSQKEILCHFLESVKAAGESIEAATSIFARNEDLQLETEGYRAKAFDVKARPQSPRRFSLLNSLRLQNVDDYRHARASAETLVQAAAKWQGWMDDRYPLSLAEKSEDGSPGVVDFDRVSYLHRALAAASRQRSIIGDPDAEMSLYPSVWSDEDEEENGKVLPPTSREDEWIQRTLRLLQLAAQATDDSESDQAEDGVVPSNATDRRASI